MFLNFLDIELLSNVLDSKVIFVERGKKKEILDMVGENAIKALEVEFAKTLNKDQV